MAAVADVVGIAYDSLFSASRDREAARARALLAYVVLTHRLATLTALSRIVHRDVATLSNGAGFVRDHLAEDPVLRNQVTVIAQRLQIQITKPDPKRQSFRAAKGKRCRVLAIMLAVALAGCIQAVMQGPWDPQGRYVCEDGKAFTVELGEGCASATVKHETGQVTLQQTAGATDAKYSDGRTTLYLDGARAVLDVGGQIFARGCVKR